MTWHEGGLFSYFALVGDNPNVVIVMVLIVNMVKVYIVNLVAMLVFKYGTAYFYGNGILTVNQGTTTTNNKTFYVTLLSE